MSNVTRNHKDNVFCLLYRDRKNLLSLYNAMNGTSYEKEEELEVTVININPGCNRELLKKCESLRGYMIFVEKVRAGRTVTKSLKEAVHQAVEECISEGVLAEFFRKHREEIVEMGIYEFDQELYDQVLREDGEAIGRKEKTLEDIRNIMETLNLTEQQAMSALKVPETERAKYGEWLKNNGLPD